MATTVVIAEERLEELRLGFSGSLLQAGDDGYDDARQVHNGQIDRRPALIARCRGTADVAGAVKFARAAGLEISVRGGGHNVAGRAVADDALMIDLSPMKGVYVDPQAQTVRAQGGATWGELNRETAAHGLAVTGGAISTTGIAGLTLGGGLGWLMAKHGLAADNLLAVELVNAEGEIVQVSEGSDSDLFWALRGGGGNFGIAASLEYRLHPLSMVTGGLIVHPVEAAGEMLRFYRDAAAATSDDLTVFAAVVHAPDGSGAKIAGMLVFHTGTPEEAEHDLAPFKEWGSPLMVEIGPMPYQVMNTILDDAYPPGLQNYWLSSFTSGISDGLIEVMVDRFASVPSPMTGILLEHFHGAVCRSSGGNCGAAPGGGLESRSSVRLGGSRRHRGERRLDTGDVRGVRTPPRRPAMAQLSRRRPGRRRGQRRLRAELRPARRAEATVRPGERLPAQPQHRPVSHAASPGESPAAREERPAAPRSGHQPADGSSRAGAAASARYAFSCLYSRSIIAGSFSSRSVITRRRYSRKCSDSTPSASASRSITPFEGTGRLPCTR
jgi:hypothetical protein